MVIGSLVKFRHIYMYKDFLFSEKNVVKVDRSSIQPIKADVFISIRFFRFNGSIVTCGYF